MKAKPAADALLADLTPAQQEAVTHGEGPLLILAGAGSGKTRVITRRVAWLLQHGVRPANILAITFTNKAANEMKQRIDALVPSSRVWISTFHSLGARLLRLYAEPMGLDRNFTIYDQTDRERIVKSSIEAANIDKERFSPAAIMGAISKAKNQLLSPERYGRQAGDYFTQTAAVVYPVYEKRMRESNALDFDDLLYWPALALKNNAELRRELDERFRYVMIDEYQDTNKAQYETARQLSVDYPNLCVVGDPDQSVYKFRGADIRNILDFERDFPNARVIALERNYRSTKAILRSASELIAHNKQRKPKSLTTENPEGEPVAVQTYETGLDEAEKIARHISAAVKAGKRHYHDFAIFMRLNALSRGLEAAFIKQRVPYQIVKGLAYYDRKETRDVLAYVRLLVNPRDNVSFERCVNEPPRGIGKVSLEHLRTYAEPRSLSLQEAVGELSRIPAIKGKAATGLRGFAKLMSELQALRESPPDEVLRQILDQSGYRKMLKESENEEDQERLANVEELITAAKQFADEDESRTIADFLENITLASDVDSWDEKQDCVSIMTLHSSKGLEFPVVYMIALEQGLLPHERSLHKTDELEEERRLAFVGMTRAKEELYLTHARMREFRGMLQYTIPSMFLSELPSEGTAERDLSTSGNQRSKTFDSWRGGSAASGAGWQDAGYSPTASNQGSAGEIGEYRVGMLVDHADYGTGKITSITGQGAMRKIKVRFPTEGEHTFIASKVKLTIVEPE